MKRIIVVGLLILTCFLLQCTLFHWLSFGGIIPNLLIVLTASFGFMRGERSGLVIGFISGILMDIFFGAAIGFYALLYMYIGYANGKFCQIFYPEDIKLPMALIICSDLIYGVVCYILMFLMRARFHFSYYFVHIILPEIVYTTLVTLFLYPIVLRINRKLEAGEKQNEKKFV
ncbi:MAG: rod shape-determining protein MreD [Lachnospiraceae bacterium]|nr:rod shape-determining protein MreD [Lachnospiraceae bacterium]